MEERVKSFQRQRMGRKAVGWIVCAGIALLMFGCASERQWGDMRPQTGPDLGNAFWGAAKLAAECFASRP